MIVRRSLPERQLLRAQRLQSGQCVRCFHASLRQAAQDGTSAQDGAEIHEPAPYNAPKRGRSRQERAAMISNEVSMLQRGPPPGEPTEGPGSLTGTYQRDPAPPTTSVGFTETPTSMGGERMGENVSAGREGPNAQGVGRITGADESARKEEPSTKSLRQAKLEEQVRLNPRQETSLRDKLLKARASGLSYKPRAPSREQLLQTGRSAATPANQDHKGLVLDRFKLVRSPAKALVAPEGRRARVLPVKKLQLGAMVAGKYPDRHLSMEEGRYKHKTLNEVMKKLAMNGTYIGKDVEKLIEKVRPLLPATMQALRPKPTAPKASQKTAKVEP